MNIAENATADSILNEVLDESPYGKQNFRPVQSKQHGTRASGEPCVLTVVNTKSSGKRITLSGDLIEKTGSSTAIQIAVNDEGIAIGGELPDNDTYFTLRKIGRKGVVYSTELVDEITALFELDFSERSSISFYDVSYLSVEDTEVAFVPLKK
ncbi:hypothetical protein NYE24_19710 [Paenibacillus sp. FSL H7-0350]|uniref:hypothetical protein n=1 Tax=Paenibacillus sp. FSL H7-0350 TaxID=2975345 RepID=UPI0031594A2D